MVLWFLCPGAPEGISDSGSRLKASQKTGPRLKVSPDRLGEAGNRTFENLPSSFIMFIMLLIFFIRMRYNKTSFSVRFQTSAHLFSINRDRLYRRSLVLMSHRI